MLERLKSGAAPEAIVRDARGGRSEPQLAPARGDRGDGKARSSTASKITSIAKGRVGRDCVAVGNILRTTDVVDAMVESFEANKDQPLAERLMRAIEAGLAAGGELKQVKSAGLLVVHRESFPFVDLRVDLSAQPLERAALPVGALPARSRDLCRARGRSRQGADAALTAVAV